VTSTNGKSPGDARNDPRNGARVDSGTLAARTAVEAAARECYGRLIAFLSARTRDVAAAEDALSEALLTALTAWPHVGIPKSPEAWLLTAARRRLTDRARHEKVRDGSALTLELLAAESFDVTQPGPIPPGPIPDERLKLLFVCAHPAIDPDMRTPLMLQTVLGLEAAQIARAFLIAPTAMTQRLVRAKNKIRHAGIAFEVPEVHELPERLGAVLNAIYAAYGNGWEDAAGVDARARGLAEEAIWLARVLREVMPDEPEVQGLLSLMLHCEARRAARRSADGRFIPLSEQDPRLWYAPLIDEAEQLLAGAARLNCPGRFQLEAAIQSVHAERARTGHTDWHAIALFYEHLVKLSPALGALVGRAAAVAEVKGSERGLRLLSEIDARAVASYQPYWAVRAHLLKGLNRYPEAVDAFDRALGLADDAAVRRQLLDRLTEISRL
jgi:RNA polymerase sigma-70 factor (ECF subfamily)